MLNKLGEIYVGNKELSITSCASYIDEECDIDPELYDHGDEDDKYDYILQDLEDMDLDTFKNKYPSAYKTFFIDKISESPHIIINYSFPLIWPIQKIYVSDGGFTVNQIAKIIRSQYNKFYEDHEKSMKEGRIPKYLPKEVRDYENLSIRFWITFTNEKKYGYGLRHFDVGTQSSCKGNTNIPLVNIGVDT